MKKFRESVISFFLFALLALGWVVALRGPDQQAHEDEYRQSANDSGGQDAWFLPLNR